MDKPDKRRFDGKVYEKSKHLVVKETTLASKLRKPKGPRKKGS